MSASDIVFSVSSKDSRSSAPLYWTRLEFELHLDDRAEAITKNVMFLLLAVVFAFRSLFEQIDRLVCYDPRQPAWIDLAWLWFEWQLKKLSIVLLVFRLCLVEIAAN